MRELAVQAANDTYDASARDKIQMEIVELYNECDRISNATQFNGVPLLTAAAPAQFVLQVGANSVVGQDTIDISSVLGDTTLDIGIGLGPGDILVWTNLLSRQTLSDVGAVIDVINARRGNLGALVNRLEGAANNLSIGIENMSASESRIRNVDVASESAKMTQAQILQQAASTILAQANQSPSLALQLLKPA